LVHVAAASKGIDHSQDRAAKPAGKTFFGDQQGKTTILSVLAKIAAFVLLDGLPKP
jgi:hypothetical protein